VPPPLQVGHNRQLSKKLEPLLAREFRPAEGRGLYDRTCAGTLMGWTGSRGKGRKLEPHSFLLDSRIDVSVAARCVGSRGSEHFG